MKNADQSGFRHPISVADVGRAGRAGRRRMLERFTVFLFAKRGEKLCRSVPFTQREKS